MRSRVWPPASPAPCSSNRRVDLLNKRNGVGCRCGSFGCGRSSFRGEGTTLKGVCAPLKACASPFHGWPIPQLPHFLFFFPTRARQGGEPKGGPGRGWSLRARLFCALLPFLCAHRFLRVWCTFLVTCSIPRACGRVWNVIVISPIVLYRRGTRPFFWSPMDLGCCLRKDSP